MIWYWDAVVMWFFHAKVIAYANKFAYEIYTYPTPPMPNYPKLLPIMAALVSEITGVYNEALPKTALVFLMFGIILGRFRVMELMMTTMDILMIIMDITLLILLLIHMMIMVTELIALV